MGSQAIKTISSRTRFLFSLFHLWRFCSRGKYCHIHLFQNSVLYLFPTSLCVTVCAFRGNTGLPFNVNRLLGVRASRSLGSSDILVMGRSFKGASTSHKTVRQPSSSNVCYCSTELSVFLIIFITTNKQITHTYVMTMFKIKKILC